MHVSPNVQVTGQSMVDMTKDFGRATSSYGNAVIGEVRASNSFEQSKGVYTTVINYESTKIVGSRVLEHFMQIVSVYPKISIVETLIVQGDKADKVTWAAESPAPMQSSPSEQVYEHPD